MLLYKNVMKIIISFIIILFFTKNIYAAIGEETGFEIPRYVSLKSNDANIRVGPSKNYPIIIKYITKNYPLMIVEEYKEWRRVKDFKNNVGWIHKSLLSGTRTGLITSIDEKDIKVFNTLDGRIIGTIGHGNIIYLEKCKIDWCFVSIDTFKGWINKKNIWGVKDSEIIKINIFQRFEDIYWKSINSLNTMKNEF